MKKPHRFASLWMASLGGLLMSSQAEAAPLAFEFVYTGTWTQPQKDALDSAAVLWSQYLSDPIIVKIEVAYASLGGGITASTSQLLQEYGYSDLRSQMVADAADEGANDSIVASLPTTFSAAVAPGKTLDNGGMKATQANLKALGVPADGLWTTNDATITFNSDLTFDYDGLLGGLINYDFMTVAAHEIGHVLGFSSSVDSALTSVVPTTLDLFRFGDANVTTLDFDTKSRNLEPGTTAYFDDAAFEYAMSTGVAGDGQQASHWKDDAITSNHIGLMDPSTAAGYVWVPTQADLRALDLIGYEFNFSPVPEISSLSSGALLLLLATRRRREPRAAR